MLPDSLEVGCRLHKGLLSHSFAASYSFDDHFLGLFVPVDCETLIQTTHSCLTLTLPLFICTFREIICTRLVEERQLNIPQNSYPVDADGWALGTAAC